MRITKVLEELRVCGASDSYADVYAVRVTRPPGHTYLDVCGGSAGVVALCVVSQVRGVCYFTSLNSKLNKSTRLNESMCVWR